MKRVVALVLVAVVALPLQATAQPDPEAPDIRVQVQEWASPLDIGLSQPFRIMVDYNCGKVDPSSGSNLTLRVAEQPDWAILSGTRTATLQADSQACLQGDLRATRNFTWSAVVTGEAPARQPATVVFNATIEYPDGPAYAETNRTIEATFLGNVRVQMAQRSRITTDDTAIHNITVDNLSNGPIRISVLAPQADPNLQLDLPGQGRAEASFRSGSTWQGQVQATGILPGDAIERTYQATIRVEAVYADDPEIEARTTDLPMEVTVRKPADEIEDNALPGFGTGVALAAVAAAILVAKAR